MIPDSCCSTLSLMFYKSYMGKWILISISSYNILEVGPAANNERKIAFRIMQINFVFSFVISPWYKDDMG